MPSDEATTASGPNANRGLCVVTGVGPGTGQAIVRRFAAGGYRVAMLARSADRLAKIQEETPNTTAYPCDVSDPAELTRALQEVRDQEGAPSVAVHNAVAWMFGNYLEVDPAEVERNFRVNVMALLHLARQVVPAMVTAGSGALVVTGNTSAHRGKPHYAGFAPTKAAQRILAQSIAREVGPKGVHVAHVTIDAVIDSPQTRTLLPEATDDFFIEDRAIADEIWHVAHQPRSAWSFEVEVRPFREPW